MSVVIEEAPPETVNRNMQPFFAGLAVAIASAGVVSGLPLIAAAAHIVCSVAVFILLGFIWKTNFAAAAGAILFAVHPLQSQAVAASSHTPLAGALAVFSLFLYCIHIKDSRRALLAISVVAAEAAVIVSPGFVSIAGVAFILDFIGFARPFQLAWRRALWLAIPTVPVAAIVHLMHVPLSLNSVPLWMRPLLPFDTAAFYLTRLAIPFSLSTGYARTPHTAAVYFIWWTWLLPAAVGTLLFLYKVGHAYLIAAALIFAAAILPFSGLFPYPAQAVSTVSDECVYFAMLGPAIALSGWLNRPRPRYWQATICLWLIVLAALAFPRIHLLQSVSFHSHA